MTPRLLSGSGPVQVNSWGPENKETWGGDE